MTTGKTTKMMLALAAVLAVAPAAEAATTVIGPYTVEVGKSQTMKSDYLIHGYTNSNDDVLLTVHGGALIYNNSKVTFDNGSLEYYIDLGPASGDRGLLILSNMTYSAGTKGNIRIGGNGGGDRAELRLYNAQHKSTSNIFRSFELSGNAATAADAFQALVISKDSPFSLSRGVVNNNEKPLDIAFAWYDPDGNFPCLDKQRTTAAIGLFNPAAGDIVLKSIDVGTAGHSTNTFIKLSATAASGQIVYFFTNDVSSLDGVVRTKGQGSVWIDMSNCLNGRRGNFVFALNAAKFDWNHAGDFIVRCDDENPADTALRVFRTTADNALPYGPQTGSVVLRSKGTDGVTDLGYAYPTLDLAGTRQKINGFSMQDGGGAITNSSSAEAVLVFGTGNIDGEVAGLNVTNFAIRCEKTGTGTLTLDGCAFNTLATDGGTVHVKSATYVDTLALTNTSVTFENGDSSLLTVRENRSDRIDSIPLPDGVATNCVFKFPVDGLYSGSTVLKDGPGFVTYMTPDDAFGASLNVNAGVLRFGGEECTNALWRLSLKKANNNGKTYSFPNGSNIFITVGIGSVNFFTSEGIGAINSTVDVGVTEDYEKYNTPEKMAANGGRRGIMSKNKPFPWDKEKAAEWGATGNTDPIFRGRSGAANMQSFFGGPNCTSNTYDIACPDETMCNAAGLRKYWNYAYVFTNAVLNPEVPSTWEVITWMVGKDSNNNIQSHTSYSVWNAVNWSADDDPYVTDWKLETSNTGRDDDWETMDERSGQRWWKITEAGSSGLRPNFNFTYNNHIPYLFKSRNANWRFTTFGKVSVAAGATLDLSELREENIAFNALAVDCTAGAGTITHFAPAANGTLYLENVPAEQAATFQLPVTIGKWINPGNIETWRVYVNGEPVENARFEIKDGIARVRRYKGIVIVF